MRTTSLLTLLLAACTGGTAPSQPQRTAPRAPLAPSVAPVSQAAPSATTPPANGSAAPVASANVSAVSASASSSATAQPAPKPPCAWKPSQTKLPRDRATFQRGGGCELAPVSPKPWEAVASVDVVHVALEEKSTLVYVAFLDAEGRRLRPFGRRVGFDAQLRARHRGMATLKQDAEREGIFTLRLPPNRRPDKPCTLHIIVWIHNGKDKVEDWVDDWLYLC